MNWVAMKLDRDPKGNARYQATSKIDGDIIAFDADIMESYLLTAQQDMGIMTIQNVEEMVVIGNAYAVSGWVDPLLCLFERSFFETQFGTKTRHMDEERVWTT